MARFYTANGPIEVCYRDTADENVRLRVQGEPATLKEINNVYLSGAYGDVKTNDHISVSVEHGRKQPELIKVIQAVATYSVLNQ